MKALTCECCGLSGDPTQVAFHERVSGWRRVHPRGRAATNLVVEQRHICGPCLDLESSKGVRWEQLSLM